MGANCGAVEKHQTGRGRSPSRRGTLTSVDIGLKSGKDFKAQYGILGDAAKGGRTSFVKKIASGRQYACQKIDKSLVPCRSPQILGQHMNKVCQLEHPHICKFVEAYEDTDQIFLIYEKAQPVTLFDHIKGCKKFDENDAAEVCRQALMALSVAHEAGIVHGRLKPSNLILAVPEDDDDKNGPPQLKITKLGQIFVMRNTSKDDGIEAFRYSAPEVAWEEIKSDDPGELPKHASKLDIWSLGALMFHMLIGRPPFISTTATVLQEEIKSGYVEFNEGEWSDISGAAREVIESMLRINACLRVDAASLLRHAWLKLEREHVPQKRMFKLLSHVYDNMHESSMKRAVLRVIAAQLPPGSKEVIDAEKAFRFLDKNGDGVLAVKEMARAMEKYLELDDADREDLFEQMDRDGSGTINLQEFIAATLKPSNAIVPEKVYLAFKAFDRDGDGTVSADEVEDMVRHLEAGLAPGEMADDLTAELRNEIQKCASAEGKLDFGQFFHLLKEGADGQTAGGVIQRDWFRFLSKVGFDCYGVEKMEAPSWQWEASPRSSISVYKGRRDSGLRRGFSIKNMEDPASPGPSPKSGKRGSLVGLKSPKQATAQEKFEVWSPPPPVKYEAEKPINMSASPKDRSPRSPKDKSPNLSLGFPGVSVEDDEYPPSPKTARGPKTSPRGSPRSNKEGDEDYPASPVSPRGRGGEDSPKRKSRKSVDEEAPDSPKSPKEKKKSGSEKKSRKE